MRRLGCEEFIRLRGQLLEGPCWDGRAERCAFAGPARDHLVITTARSGHAQAPTPGGICSCATPGLPDYPWRPLRVDADTILIGVFDDSSF